MIYHRAAPKNEKRNFSGELLNKPSFPLCVKFKCLSLVINDTEPGGEIFPFCLCTVINRFLGHNSYRNKGPTREHWKAPKRTINNFKAIVFMTICQGSHKFVMNSPKQMGKAERLNLITCCTIRRLLFNTQKLLSSRVQQQCVCM